MSGIATAIIGSAVIGGIASNSASRRAADASRGASDAAALQAQIGAEQWDKYQEIYNPLEKDMVQEAQNYATPENYQRAAGEAAATNASEYAKARDRLARTPGMDPSAPGSQDRELKLELAAAASGSTAQNAARLKVRDTAWARKVDALSMGKGLPAQASSILGSAASTNSGIANNQYALASAQASNAGQFTSNLFTAARNNGWLNTSTAPRPGLLDAGTPPGVITPEGTAFA